MRGAEAWDLGPAELLERVTEVISGAGGEEPLSELEAVRLLRHPHAGRELVERLAAVRGLRASPRVRRELAGHRHTPQGLALDLLPTLFWRDLAALGSSVRTPPLVRRAADRRLAARLPQLTLGEKISLGRTAGVGVLPRLLADPHPRVVAAALANPRLAENAVLALARSDAAPPAVLAVLARHRRWGVRYAVRQALATNPATPQPVALSMLPHLRKADLLGVARSVRAPQAIRRRARLLTGGGPRETGRS